MRLRASLMLCGLTVVVTGCLTDDNQLPTVSSNPFRKLTGTHEASFKHAQPATEETSKRVLILGQKLVTANPRIRQKVAFMTIGVPQEEIFHVTQHDASAVYVTEGLVKQCNSDGELAAVLSQELGKIVAEDSTPLQPRPSWLDRPTVMSPHVGNDNPGMLASDNLADQLVRYKLEKQREDTRKSLPAQLDAKTLARGYLTSAGFQAKELDTVAPLLRKASKQNSIERSMTGKQ